MFYRPITTASRFMGELSVGAVWPPPDWPDRPTGSGGVTGPVDSASPLVNFQASRVNRRSRHWPRCRTPGVQATSGTDLAKAVVGDNVSNMSSNQQGFTLTELVVICAVIGILSTIAIPTFMNALQTMRSRGAVAEMKTGLNRAKQLAITTRQNICVQAVAGGGYRFLLGGCAGGAWIGTGTTAAGNLILSNNVTITNGGNGAGVHAARNGHQRGELDVHARPARRARR